MISSIRHVHKAVLIALILAIVSGCGGNAGNTGSAISPASENGTAGQPSAVQGGTFTYALAGSPSGLDPNVVPAALDYRVMRSIYDSLVVQLPDQSIKPWLAEEWTVSSDGKEYTFKLRKDVKFHDGTPFNAAAVKANFDRIVNPATKSRFAVTLLGPYESSEAVDEYTVKVRLKSPYSAFLSSLSQAFLGIVSPAAAEKYKDQLTKNPVGTGPFKFVSWTENSAVTLQRNPDYKWAPELAANKGAPYIDKLVFKIIPEEATRIGSVQSGQVSAAETVPPQNFVSLKKDPNVQLFQAESSGIPYTLMLNQDHAPWNELEARKAVQLSIDFDAIVKTLYLGAYTRAWSPLTPSVLGYNASLEGVQKPDPDEAGRLLDGLGWIKGADGIREKNGKKLTIRYIDASPNREKRNDIAAMIQQQLKKAGIAVEVEILADTTPALMVKGTNDLVGVSNVSGDPDILRSFFHTNAIPKDGKWGHNHTHKSDPQVDAWLEEGLKEQDPKKRAEIYKQVQAYLIQNAYGFPVYVFPYTVAAGKNVNGLKFDSLGYPLFYDVSLKKS
ncbi:ABC transporter substrate-binding protein [Paenibacillus chitinolyticus]|uniref:ABC transporter substrate-binding protein n=1 Tax=Paenibacillus chitinolyticus TaxID=79263 RepID=A0A410WXJ3_9BACL|nr:ABC transporter substrate-binding protein [Paenibacillus chitinolyticus]MCY9589617.1 ABC transporter substrate-binding protein [Paenibacillus chitinolyticus]MCY9598382.1 ABC transporter substrate-binding protein [Paenibacillus chitinolyticus]QAV19002.1 ABC transporter substrate-binding protein [Paenibacillus chitinolyticus]